MNINRLLSHPNASSFRHGAMGALIALVALVVPLLIITPWARAQNLASANAGFGHIAINAAEIFESPNTQKPAPFVLSRWTPIKILTRTGEFVKITDVWGNSGWLRERDINTQGRMVVAKWPVTTLYKAANLDSGVAYEVNKDVALHYLAFENGMLKVRHIEGGVAFVPINAVAGVSAPQ